MILGYVCFNNKRKYKFLGINLSSVPEPSEIYDHRFRARPLLFLWSDWLGSFVWGPIMFMCKCFYRNQLNDLCPPEPEPFSLPAPIPQWPPGMKIWLQRFDLWKFWMWVLFSVWVVYGFWIEGFVDCDECIRLWWLHLFLFILDEWSMYQLVISGLLWFCAKIENGNEIIRLM